jgi:cytochrome P450
MATAIDFDPLQYDVQQDLYTHYARLRDEAPVHYIESLETWGLFRYEEVAYTLKHPELFSARDFIEGAFGEFDPVPEVPSIIAMDPPEHTRIRKLANKAFLPSVIRAMEPRILELIEGLLDEVQERHPAGEPFDFVSEFAAYVPVSVTASILGVDPQIARGDFKRWTMDLLKAPSRSALPQEELDGMRKSVDELRAYFEEQIEYRRTSPGTDLVSALVRAEEDDQTLSAAEVLSLIVLLQFGGAETPSHLISSTLWELFEQPDALATVKADPSRTGDAVEETLRHVSPVHFIFQTATQDIEMLDQTIPAGSGVFAFIGSANRDQRAFEDPDGFDIDRSRKTKHLSFAQGAHFCIGAPLGRLMCTAAAAAALKRFPNLHPVEDTVEWMPSFWVRGLQRYPVAY